MAHELDMTTGRAAIAFVGETPWHGLGSRLQPGAPLETWQAEAGLDWEAKLAPVLFNRQIMDTDGQFKSLLTTKDDSRVVYRSDTGDALGVASDRYRPVQPKEAIEFFRDLTESHGFVLETAGALKNGKRIWALARTGESLKLRGNDVVDSFVLFSTSFDGSSSTNARHTAVRVVCNNTWTAAMATKGGVSVPHSTVFDASKVKLELKIGDDWAKLQEQATAMSSRIVTRDETLRFLLDVYHGLTTTEEIREASNDEKKDAQMKKTMERLTEALFNAPGANMTSANGTLWGLAQAVFRDVDFAKPARSQANRLEAAWFGSGEALKQEAWNRAVSML